MESSSVTSLEIESDAVDDCTKKELRRQISVLQNAVIEMKSAFASAVQQLGCINHQDQTVQELIQQSKGECQDQIAEVVKLILSLQAEFGSVKCQIQQIQEAQCRQQQQFQGLLVDQELLLDELRKSASISDQFRHQFKYCRELRSSVGSQSNDSGVALLLERAQAGFSHLGFPTASDHDSVSIPETSRHLVTSMVHDYVAGLGHPAAASHVCSELEPDASNYDSDSSLVIAANKSLTLSSSLGKQCGLELQHEGSSEEESMEEARPYASLTEEKRSLSQVLKSDVTVRAMSEKSYPHILRKRRQYLSPASDRVPPLIIPDSHNPHYQEAQRLKISKMILETERKYCKKLWVLQDVYMEPLKRNRILSSKDYNTLFPEEIFKLYEKHCIVLHKLEERIQSWQWNGIVGDIILKFISSDESCILHLYTSYVNDFPEVLKTFYKQCRHSEQFTKFLKERMKYPTCINSDLTQFLLIPVQRIPIYIIHLKRILNYTGFDHPDYDNVTSCLNRLRDFLARLNDSMEHSFQLMTAQITPQIDLAHNLKSSTFSLKNPKPSFRELDDAAESSSDNESFRQEEMRVPQKMKTFLGGSKESMSYDKSYYNRKQKDKDNLVTSKLCHNGSTSAALKTFNHHSSASLASCDHAKALSKSLESRLSRQSAVAEDFDYSRAELCYADDGFAGPQSSGELEDDDSIFNDRVSVSSKSEPLGFCSSKIHRSPASAKRQNFGENFVDSNSNSTPPSSIASKSLHSLTGSSNNVKLIPFEEKFKCGETNVDGGERRDKLCKDKYSRGNAGGSAINILGSHHSSNVNLATTMSSNQVRPLIKAHSTHAVHQLLKEQSGSSNKVALLCKAGASEDLDERRKAKAKNEKKRVSLRSLRNMFFRKRGFVNHMNRTVDMGTCTSHDELSPTWGNLSLSPSNLPS